jgi:hypothetical protein
MQRTGNGFEWSFDSDEDDKRSMGPEDYAWAAASHGRPHLVRVPDLEWVWDSSPSELMAFQLSMALQQPLGSA